MLDLLDFYVVVPQAATNYVTNPTPYRSTTGYTASNSSIALDSTHVRRGPRCIKVTPTVSLSGVYFSNVSVTSLQDYTFSVDVKGQQGKSMRIRVQDAGATFTYQTVFLATGNWQRISVSFSGQENASDYRLYVLRDPTTGTDPFWVDGFQFEDGDEMTTFFSGDTKGFGKAPLEFYWLGEPHASASYRTADTRAGGALLNIKDYALINKQTGLGMGSFKQIYTELSAGGAFYQRHVRQPRVISLLLTYYGTSPGELHAARSTILDAVKPDWTGYDQPMILRYQGTDEDGDETAQPLDIVCVFEPSHMDTPDNMFSQKDFLTFTVLDGYLGGAYVEGTVLTEKDEFAVESIATRDITGAWNNMSGGTGNTSTIYVMIEAPNGDIIVGGSFTSMGSVSNTAYIARWNGSSWSSLTGSQSFNGAVRSLAFDAEGNLYIGGDFTDAGDSNGDRIVMWDGTSLNSLGTGLQGSSDSCEAIAIDPDTGDVYAGGTFDSAGGIGSTQYIARWDGSSWNSVGTLNDFVMCMQFGPDGNLYIGGRFDSADGSDGDHICYWDGSAYHALDANAEVSSDVYNLQFDSSGRLYIVGSFTNVGGDTDVHYMAMWDGSKWAGLGKPNYSVTNLWIDDENDTLYVVGSFTAIDDIYFTDMVAKYKAGTWSALEINLPGTQYADSVLVDSRGNFFVGGYFSTVYETPDEDAVAGAVAECTNTGNAKVFPTIEITGPGKMRSITNYDTHTEIQFNGLTLQPGEVVTIQPVSGQVLLSSTWKGRGYMQRYINPGSDINAFYLKPGTNNIVLYMPEDTDSNTLGLISWTPKFWNIERCLYE